MHFASPRLYCLGGADSHVPSVFVTMWGHGPASYKHYIKPCGRPPSP